MIIYVVKSSKGSYEDYSEWIEKAFYKKEDAKKYARELDLQHSFIPDFVTDEFEAAFQEANYEAPEWPEYNGKGSYNSKEYQEYCKVNTEAGYNFIINYLKDKGFEVTREMIDTYEKWDSDQYDTYYPSTIEEVELV